jgi:hypothetical protein
VYLNSGCVSVSKSRHKTLRNFVPQASSSHSLITFGRLKPLRNCTNKALCRHLDKDDKLQRLRFYPRQPAQASPPSTTSPPLPPSQSHDSRSRHPWNGPCPLVAILLEAPGLDSLCNIFLKPEFRRTRHDQGLQHPSVN